MLSPKRVTRGIRSSYELDHTPTSYAATVREIPAPSHVVVDAVTGVLRPVRKVVAP